MFNEEEGFKDEEGWIPWFMPLTSFISTAGTSTVGTIDEMEQAIEALQQMKNTWGESSVSIKFVPPPKPRVIVQRSVATLRSVTIQLIFPNPADREILIGDAVFDVAYWDAKMKKVKKTVPEESIKRIIAPLADLEEGLKIEGLEANKSYAFCVTTQEENAAPYSTNDPSNVVSSEETSEKMWTQHPMTAVGRPLKYPAVRLHWSAIRKSIDVGKVTLAWTRSAVQESQIQSGTRTYNIGIWDEGGKRYVFAHDADWNKLTYGIKFTEGSECIAGNTVTIKGLGSQRYTFGIQECAKADWHNSTVTGETVQSSTAKVSISLRTKKARYAAPPVKKEESATGQTFTISPVPPHQKPTGLVATGYQVGLYDSALKTYIFEAAPTQTLNIGGNQVCISVQGNALIVGSTAGQKIKLSLREAGTLPSGDSVYSAKRIIKIK